MLWILDDGPFNTLSLFLEQDLPDERACSWEPGVLLIADTTADSATTFPPRQRLLEFTASDGQQLVERLSAIHPVDERFVEVFEKLRPTEQKADANVAEHQTIAWIQIHDPRAVFVTTDQRAAMLALAELGRGRVAHPFDLWIDLLDRSWIQPPELDQLCERTMKASNRSLPRLPDRLVARVGDNEPSDRG